MAARPVTTTFDGNAAIGPGRDLSATPVRLTYLPERDSVSISLGEGGVERTVARRLLMGAYRGFVETRDLATGKYVELSPSSANHDGEMRREIRMFTRDAGRAVSIFLPQDEVSSFLGKVEHHLTPAVGAPPERALVDL